VLGVFREFGPDVLSPSLLLEILNVHSLLRDREKSNIVVKLLLELRMAREVLIQVIVDPNWFQQLLQIKNPRFTTRPAKFMNHILRYPECRDFLAQMTVESLHTMDLDLGFAFAMGLH
jgi:hypothetical protein